MSIRFELSNILTQDDSFGTVTARQRLNSPSHGIICVTPVVPEGTRIRLDSIYSELLYPFQLIQTEFRNFVEITHDATLTLTGVTINENIPLEFVIFGHDEIPYVPQMIERINIIRFRITDGTEKELRNLNLKKCLLRGISTGSNTAFRIRSRLALVSSSDTKEFNIQGFNSILSAVQLGNQKNYDIIRNLSIQRFEGSGSMDFTIAYTG